VAGMASPYNPNAVGNGGPIMRKRSGTSHAQKSSFKGSGMNQMYEELGHGMSPMSMQTD
jgi:hypothetical protein